ncbi:glycerophosphoryl diester phosphodiesterase [Kribbella flavida DSM 17836]|uniref:Glycerophosphoryl diester phosphodiesterase n=1 Tax=Kribbella flavida (strain DSM 17836 / JCM 10339 / NBRC 14399) TaxID=479435 RepID=D2PMV0_KRIFD|nr:glycerophosphodiester phosphodiesterase [Kribbella flavida]ADB32652.1 glycerophosphoryl diester phosphodiesterase [Kribbella flavida DSM 17836]
MYPYLDHEGPIAMAHRGGALHPDNVGYENSLRAFGHAVQLGYRYLETDLHATRDGVVVAFHDHRLDRVTDRTGVIAELPWSEVRKARINGHEPIPLLTDVLEQFPGVRLNLDVKADNGVGPAAAVLRDTGTVDRVCVSSFSQARVRRIRRELGPRLATGFGQQEIARLRFAPFRLDSPGACLQIPEVYGRIRVLTPGLLRRAHALGKQVHVWTVDDPAAMHRLLDAGVDGIITDRTDVLRDVLLARGQWS